MISSVFLPVHAENPLSAGVGNLDIATHFPVVAGDLRELDGYFGNIPAVHEAGVKLRKPALQHHRSAQVLHPDDEFSPVTLQEDGQTKVVTAKGVNMTRPKLGVVTNDEGRHFPFTYGLMSQAEVGRQFERSISLKEAGVTTESFLGFLVLDAYVVDGQTVSPDEFWENAIKEFEQKLSFLNAPATIKAEKEAALHKYALLPHIVLLRATESALRLADVQDNPSAHLSEMLASAGTDSIDSYFELAQARAASNMRGLRELGLVHRALYHGGNLTTNLEVVDLDTMRTIEDYADPLEFHAASAQDVEDVSNNIERLQIALGRPAETKLFRSLVAA